MKYLLSTLFTLCAFIALGQTSIKIEEISKHIGDSVTVCGKVAGGKYMEQSDRKLTLLNVGAAFPNQLFTIVIDNDLRGQFEPTPETFFLEKNICVTGKIALFRDKPQILIYKKEQLQVSK